MLENEIFLSLLPIIIFNSVFLLIFISFAFVYPKRKNKVVASVDHGTFLGVYLREFGYWFITPFIWFFKTLKFTPNTLTCTSLAVTFVAAYLYSNGSFSLAGWIFILASSFDTMDGRLARLTGQVSKEGAFLDSTLDRYSDGILLMGLAMFYRDNYIMLLLTILTIIGTEVVSYSKARGECNGIITHSGLMQRPERIILLAFFSIFYPFFSILLNNYNMPVKDPMAVCMFFMAVLTNYTAVIRIVSIFREIRAKS